MISPKLLAGAIAAVTVIAGALAVGDGGAHDSVMCPPIPGSARFAAAQTEIVGKTAVQYRLAVQSATDAYVGSTTSALGPGDAGPTFDTGGCGRLRFYYARGQETPAALAAARNVTATHGLGGLVAFTGVRWSLDQLRHAQNQVIGAAQRLGVERFLAGDISPRANEVVVRLTGPMPAAPRAQLSALVRSLRGVARIKLVQGGPRVCAILDSIPPVSTCSAEARRLAGSG